MADGVNITPGTGVKISSEEVTTLNGGSVGAQQVGRAGVAIITSDGVADDVTSSNPLPVTTDGLTDTQLRASSVPVDTGLTQPTTPSDTQPVSATSLPLPTGSATAAKQDTGNTSLASIDGKITAVNTGAVTVSSSALPTGAATAAKQPALGTAGTASADVITVQGKASMTPLLVDGSATTQPVSAASLPLPTGAATAAKQPALGTAGTASADVITVQGKTSMTPLLVDASATTQPVSGTVTVTGVATATKQSDGSQKTQIVDGSGNVIASTSNALNVAITSGGGSGGTASSFGAAFPATGTAIGISDGTNMLALKGDATNGAFVNVKTSVLPTGASTAAKQPALGTAGSASADVLTVQGVASMTALKTDGSGVTQPVSGTVTANAGTNLNTSLLALEAGGNLASIKADVDKIPSQGQALAAASTPVVLTAAQVTTLTPPAAITNYANETGGNLATLAGAVTSSVVQTNGKQINGVTPLMGNGVTGTGSQRVTIASDNTAFSVNSTLSAETTKVIGVTRTADGAGNLLTSNSTTPAAHFALDNNITSILGTAPTTVGKLDVKGADGDVFVRQATASNLNATVVGTGTFVTQSTLAAETTKVIGVTRSADGSGNLLTSTTNALDVNLKTSSITLNTQEVATATGGYTPSHLISGASTNATSVKGSAGTIGYLTASNINASPRYLKIYNKATAPTVGTDVPVHTFLIPGNASGAGTNIPIPSEGIALGTGIGLALTTGVADNDTGAVAANDIVVNYGWI